MQKNIRSLFVISIVLGLISFGSCKQPNNPNLETNQSEKSDKIENETPPPTNVDNQVKSETAPDEVKKENPTVPVVTNPDKPTETTSETSNTEEPKVFTSPNSTSSTSGSSSNDLIVSDLTGNVNVTINTDKPQGAGTVSITIDTSKPTKISNEEATVSITFDTSKPTQVP